MEYHYCKYCLNLPDDNIHKIHHDEEYGVADISDNQLFGMLILEINQAGLSWETILKKRENFYNAYSKYDIQKIAAYQQADIDRLLSDSGIVRNKLKINSIVLNANKVIELQKEFGSFFDWIKIQQCQDIKEWVKTFKKHFKFVGGEICNEFLMQIGRIDGAHAPDCFRYEYYMERRKVWD